MDSKGRGCTGCFAAYLGLTLEYAEPFIPKSCANVGSDWEGCWREGRSLDCAANPLCPAPAHPGGQLVLRADGVVYTLLP